jgi:hypothetical protein
LQAGWARKSININVMKKMKTLAWSQNKQTFSSSRLAALLGSMAVFFLITFALMSRGIGRPTIDLAFFRPAPDTAEQLWIASSFSRFHTPLIPIAHEYHPSRYSPVHSWLVGLYLLLTCQGPGQAQ